MVSLKAFLPVLAPILATTPDALYSRQRSLVHLGLLTTRKGRGPGSGVELSAESLAVLLIACLCSETLAETDERVATICGATDVFTKETFLEACVATLLEPDNHTNQTLSLSVSNDLEAQLAFSRNGEIGARIYGAKKKRGNIDVTPRHPITRILHIRLDTLQQIRLALRKSVSEASG